MKLLIITQAVDRDNPILGFFIDWIKEFVEHYEYVTAICLERGNYNLPVNVKILSLGKEGGASRIKYIFNFYKYIWQERKNYDQVFVHMNPIYVILGGFFWRVVRKKIGLWYVHKEVDLKLKLSEKIADFIFTASEESNGLKSKKVKVLSHGINLRQFFPGQKDNDGFFNILYVGRISPIKNQFLLVKALKIIVEDGNADKLKIKLIGDAISDNDKEYKQKIKDFVEQNKLEQYVEFVGFVPNDKIVDFYHRADLSINLCPTGGLDKAVLESMLCGVPAIVLNKTFTREFGKYSSELILNNDDSNELAEKILKVKEMSKVKKEEMRTNLIVAIKSGHNLEDLILKIVASFSGNQRAIKNEKPS